MTLLPQKIEFISYPYEWSFGQLKDAALLTLAVTRSSIEKGMILKDATPYNIQFIDGKPVFIDTLSFTRYDASKPWIAYRQFCQLSYFRFSSKNITSYWFIKSSVPGQMEYLRMKQQHYFHPAQGLIFGMAACVLANCCWKEQEREERRYKL